MSRLRSLWQAIGGALRKVLETPVGIARKDDPLVTLYHQPLPPRLKWNWWALLLGPFWYCGRGLWIHGVILLTIAFLSGGLLIPFVWLYAALKANEDLLEFRIARRSVY